MTNTIDSDALTNLGLLRPRQASGPSDELGQAQFLELMITQLRNQDPFKPMESGEFLGQLAQFGTVSGIDDVRGALADLTNAMSANQTMQAAGLVDRDAYVAAHEAWLQPGGRVRGAVVVPENTNGASLSVYDMNGRLVATRALQTTGADAGSFAWDGLMDGGEPAPSGYYELRAAGDVAGTSTALEVLVAGRIESVSLENAGGTIGLTVTGLGRVDLTAVRRVSANHQ
jgi:flagellar basal-body rod modification protein FlgD